MKKLNIDNLVAVLEASDENPPEPDFNLEDFGKKVADGCDPVTARDVVFACYTRLHHTMAGDFLRGFLGVAFVENLEELLFNRLVATDDVSAASSIVDTLIAFAKLSAADVAERLLDHFSDARDEQVQANLSYGVWVLTCSWCWDLRDDSLTRLWTYSPSDPASVRLRERLQIALRRQDLSTYARKTFSECIESISKPQQEQV